MSARGFSLLETTIALGVIGLVLTGGILLAFIDLNDTRDEETIDKLLQLKRAIVGDPRIVTKEARTDFGFIGDIGGIPATLSNLWIRGSTPIFSFDKTAKAGFGWQGPYMTVGPSEYFDQIGVDAWGSPIVYDTTAATSATTQQQYVARLISYGADYASGGGDDRTIEIYSTEASSKVVGYVRDSAKNPMAGVTVKINLPNGLTTSSLALTSKTTQTLSTGAFEFNDIPFGNRSIAIQPRLVYVSGSGVTTPPSSGDTVEFVVQNFSSSNVSFDCFKAEFDANGSAAGGGAFYETLKVGNTTVFNYTDFSSNRAGTGEIVYFPTQSQSVVGAGSISGQTFPIRVQNAFTQVPDQNIGESASRGGSVRITMGNFVSAETGNGSKVNMTQITITATIASGAACTTDPSIAIFSPVKK